MWQVMASFPMMQFFARGYHIVTRKRRDVSRSESALVGYSGSCFSPAITKVVSATGAEVPGCPPPIDSV